MEQGSKGVYIPHHSLENLSVKYSIIQLRDETKALNQYLDVKLGANESHLELYMESQIIVNGQPIEPAQQHALEKKLLLNQDIHFNYDYKDLSYNSIISITIWCVGKNFDKKQPLGATTVSLFDDEFKLRQGKLHLYIWPNTLPDNSYSSKTSGLVLDQNIEDIKSTVQKIEYYTNKATNELQNQIINTLNLKMHYTGQKVPGAFLEIEFPSFKLPVFYEDIQYSDFKLIQNITTTKKNQQYIQNSNFADCIISADFDFENGQNDPAQELFMLIDQDVNAQDIRPNSDDAMKIKKLIVKPILGEMVPQDKKLFYRYRYYLKENKDALVKFLHSINWKSSREKEECMKLLKLWSPCDYGDALHILSSFFCANDIYNKKNRKPLEQIMQIRSYAVEQLRKVSQDILQLLLLQLVQALRYENIEKSIEHSDLAKFLIESGSKDKTIASQLLWFLKVESEKLSQNDIKKINQANVITQQEAEKIINWYETILESFQRTVEEQSPEIFQILQDQENFRNKLIQLFLDMKQQSRNREDHIKIMQQKFRSSPEFREQHKRHSFCLFPDLEIQEPIPENCTIFKSAMAPMKMDWKGQNLVTQEDALIQFLYKQGDDLRQDQLILQVFKLLETLLKEINQDFRLTPYGTLACSKNDGFMEFVPHTRTLQSIIEKYKGESLIKYFQIETRNPDNVLYKDREGYKSKDKQQREEFEKQLVQENQNNFKNINKTMMDNYILSCAGYCVITYFLGIGDRHLENIMIQTTGKMLHIDFGFILGQDPKLGAPPFKLSPDMVEGMGGFKHNNYEILKQKCVDIYKYLRKYCKLIVNLFYLMQDAGIPDITLEAISKMTEKFCLDESDERAERHFLNILEASTNAFLANFNDKIHQIAVNYFRK